MIKDEALAMEWIPVCRAEEIKDAPVQVTIVGEQVALFRASTGIKALKDLCIHRGANLSIGKVKDDCIACAYHGWEYDGDGRCTKIPQLTENQAIPLKARAIPYACLEKYGLVWVNLGNNKPDAPAFGPIDDEAFRNVWIGPFDVSAAAPRFIESALDVAHFAFAHDGYLGDSSQPLVPEYEVNKIGRKIVTSEFPMYQPKQVGGEAVVNHYFYEIHGPLTMSVTIVDRASGNIVYIMASVQPVDDRHCKVFQIFAINFEMNMDNFVPYQTFLFNQDKYVVEHQFPEDLPLDLQEELHLRPDRLSIAYRKSLAELGVTMGTA
jgi:phenylpropionate dioxygenase-like ring-hydroxylating dioxygenase large terminal subunit